MSDLLAALISLIHQLACGYTEPAWMASTGSNSELVPVWITSNTYPLRAIVWPGWPHYFFSGELYVNEIGIVSKQYFNHKFAHTGEVNGHMRSHNCIHLVWHLNQWARLYIIGILLWCVHQWGLTWFLHHNEVLVCARVYAYGSAVVCALVSDILYNFLKNLLKNMKVSQTT